MLASPRQSRPLDTDALVALSRAEGLGNGVASRADDIRICPDALMLGARRNRNWWLWAWAAGAALLVVWVSVSDWGWLWKSS